jgi:hypothetical protein
MWNFANFPALCGVSVRWTALFFRKSSWNSHIFLQRSKFPWMLTRECSVAYFYGPQPEMLPKVFLSWFIISPFLSVVFLILSWTILFKSKCRVFARILQSLGLVLGNNLLYIDFLFFLLSYFFMDSSSHRCNVWSTSRQKVYFVNSKCLLCHRLQTMLTIPIY